MVNKCLLIAIVSALSGCATRDHSPENTYVESSLHDQMTTISGSQVDSFWFGDYTAYVSEIDGQVVAGGRETWQHKLSLSSEMHALTVRFERAQNYAEGSLSFKPTPGHDYELRFATSKRGLYLGTLCTFWIYDLTNATVASPTVQGNIRVRPSNTIQLPLYKH